MAIIRESLCPTPFLPPYCVPKCYETGNLCTEKDNTCDLHSRALVTDPILYPGKGGPIEGIWYCNIEAGNVMGRGEFPVTYPVAPPAEASTVVPKVGANNSWLPRDMFLAFQTRYTMSNFHHLLLELVHTSKDRNLVTGEMMPTKGGPTLG